MWGGLLARANPSMKGINPSELEGLALSDAKNAEIGAERNFPKQIFASERATSSCTTTVKARTTDQSSGDGVSDATQCDCIVGRVTRR